MTDKTDRDALLDFKSQLISAFVSMFAGFLGTFVIYFVVRWMDFQHPWEFAIWIGFIIALSIWAVWARKWFGLFDLPVARFLNTPSIHFQDAPMIEAPVPVERQPSLFDRLHVTPEQLNWVAAKVETGMHLSIRRLRFKFQSDEAAQTFQDALLHYGLAQDRQPENPQGGIELTERGRAFMHQWYLEHPPYPTQGRYLTNAVSDTRNTQTQEEEDK